MQQAVSSVVGNVPVKLVVAIPAGGNPELDFMNCMLYMSMYIMQYQLPMPLRNGNHFEVLTKRGSMLPPIRQGLVEDALELGADYMLFLDTDQLFPANTAHRLMKWDKDVVACNIATKLLPPATNPTACQKGNSDTGEFVYTTDDKHGLERVWRVGCGVMMLKPSIFRRIPKPWFKFEWDEPSQRFQGEDWYLCRKLEEAGVDIWIDHDLSREVGHEGKAVFTHEMANLSKSVRDENPEAFSAERRRNVPGIIAAGGTR